jgi:hypothetical protein
VHVVVETPRGSRAKFAYDLKLDSFILSKSLLTGLTCPPIKSVIADAEPRYGTWTMLVPVIIPNNSPAI